MPLPALFDSPVSISQATKSSELSELDDSDNPGISDAPESAVEPVADEVAPPLDGAAPESVPAESPAEDSDYSELTPESDTEVDAEEPAEEIADEISDELIEQVRDRYGLSEEEIRAFGTPATLDKALGAFDRQMAEIGRQILAQQQPAEQPAPQQAAQPTQQPPAAQPTQQEVDLLAEIESYKLELDPAEYDPNTIKAFQGLNEHYDKHVRTQHGKIVEQQKHIEALTEVSLALREQFEQITGRYQAEDSARFEQEMDSFFTGLGDEFKATFGTGGITSLKSDAPERVARIKLVEEMNALQIADAQLNRPRSSPVELRQRALRSLHGNIIKTSARKELIERNGKRNTQSLARPAGRQAKARTRDESAVRAVDAILRKQGAYNDAAIFD